MEDRDEFRVVMGKEAGKLNQRADSEGWSPHHPAASQAVNPEPNLWPFGSALSSAQLLASVSTPLTSQEWGMGRGKSCPIPGYGLGIVGNWELEKNIKGGPGLLDIC